MKSTLPVKVTTHTNKINVDGQRIYYYVAIFSFLKFFFILLPCTLSHFALHYFSLGLHNSVLFSLISLSGDIDIYKNIISLFCKLLEWFFFVLFSEILPL